MGDSARTKPPATCEDLLRAPDHLVAEIVDGDLYTSPRPAPRHAHAAGVIVGDMEPPFGCARGGPGGWRILFEPELHLGRDILVPDIAGWRRERLSRLPDEAFFPLARILEVLHLDAGHWTLLGTHGEADVVRLAPFAGVELELASVWGD